MVNPGVYGSTGVYVGELHPTHLRATAVGWFFGIGRIGSFLAPAVVGLMLAYGLGHYVLHTFALTFLLASFALIAIGIETKGRVLEEITEPGGDSSGLAPAAPVPAAMRETASYAIEATAPHRRKTGQTAAAAAARFPPSVKRGRRSGGFQGEDRDGEQFLPVHVAYAHVPAGPFAHMLEVDGEQFGILTGGRGIS